MKKLKRKSLKIRKNIKEAALAAITAGSLSVVMELRRELSEFLIRRYRICVPDPRGIGQDSQTTVKLVFLSDLHGKRYGTGNQELIRAVKHEKPDYILVGGDLVTRSNPKTDAIALELIRQLVKDLPQSISLMATMNRRCAFAQKNTETGMRNIWLQCRKQVSMCWKVHPKKCL